MLPLWEQGRFYQIGRNTPERQKAPAFVVLKRKAASARDR